MNFVEWPCREFGFAWLPLTLFLAVAGLASAYKRDRTVFWFLLLIVLADLAYALSYEIAEDKDAYYLPAFISIAIAAGLGIRWLIQLAASRRSPMWTTVCGCCDCDCPDIGYSVRCELAIQQSQALLHCR